MEQRFARRTFRPLLAALFALGVAGTATADGLEPFQSSFQLKAERALAQGDPLRALTILAAPDTTPVNRRDLAELHGLRCEAFIALERPVEAIGACQAAIDARGSSATWRFLNNQGVAHLMLDEFDAAQTAFRNARTLNPRATAPRRNLSLLADFRAEESNDLAAMVLPAQVAER